MSAGAGFGSFMEGLQGGISSMQDIRRKKQLDKLYDQEITLGGEKVTGRDHSRARAGLDPLKKFSSGDPFLFRLMDKLGRGQSSTESPVVGAIPTAGEFETRPQSVAGNLPIDDQDLSGIEMPDYQFADGTAGGLGDWLDDEKAGKPKRDKYNADSKAEIESRAQRARSAGSGAAREAVPTQVIDRSAEKSLGQKVAAKAGQAAKYEGYGLAAKPGAGMLSKAGRFAGRVAAPLAIGGAAAGGIRGALDAETTGDGFWSDVGQRAVGAGKGVVAGLLDPIGAFTGDRGEEAPATAAPAEAVPTGPSAPVGSAARTQAMSRTSSQVRPSAPATAIPAAAPAAEEASPLDGFDVSKIPAEEIPNVSVKDWENFRAENIKELVSNGMSYAEAWDKVDQQTVATQQRGFMHFAKQAYMALGKEGKYSPAAASAARAAFQYLPSTTDIKVGNYNGHLVAFSIDEETGEQVGSPMVITPDFLQSAMVNFADPKAWAEHAQDNRKLDQADRQLGQADRELGQGDRRIGALERANEIDAFKARTAAIGGGSGGEDGMKRSDAARNRTTLENGAFEMTDDPNLRSMYIAVMAEMDREDGGYNPEKVVAEIKQLAATPEGQARIKQAYSALTGR